MNPTAQLWKDGEMNELLPCPFCGGEAYQHQFGNEHTRMRGFDVGCKVCRIKIADRVQSFSLDWCKRKNSENWNRRINP